MCEPKVYKKGDTPPDGRTLFPPQEGWEEKALYLVDVVMRRGNPIHRSYLKVGFLDDKKQPAGYSEIWNNSYGEAIPFTQYHYLRVIRKLHSPKDDE